MGHRPDTIDTSFVPRRRVVPAYVVHAYTASGLLAGFMGLKAIYATDAQLAFLWMLIAVLIDATDGMLARGVHVKQVLPRVDGEKLDAINDYLNGVVLPVVLLYEFDLLPAKGTLLFVAAPLMVSVFRVCYAEIRVESEAGHFFRGFPSTWQFVAFYLYLGDLEQWLNGVLVCLFAVAGCVPIRFVYPSLTRPLWGVTNTLGALWFVVLFIVLGRFPNPPDWLVLGSLGYPVYYFVVSLYLHLRTPPKANVPPPARPALKPKQDARIDPQ